MELINPALVQAWQKGFSVPERLAIKDFSEKYVSLPNSYAVPGRFSASRSKYLLEVFRALEDERVRIVLIKAAVQTGKTLALELFIPWLISNFPGNILYLTADEDLSKKIVETRLNPILSNCDPVKQLLPVKDRFARKKSSIIFADSTSLICGGANEGNLQSLSVRYLIGDECWLWKAGYLEQFIARANAFPNNSKILLISQAPEDSHDFAQLWDKGHGAEWAFKCPHCGELQTYSFNVQREDKSYAGAKWDKNETTKPNGKYNFVEVGKTARFECLKCRQDIYDTPAIRRQLNDGGEYVIKNPTADPAIKSFTWNALANIDITFSKVVTEYLQAKESDEVAGNRIPLKNFNMKILARNWSDNLSQQINKVNLGDYDVNVEWPDEAHRFLTIDVQSNCFWYVVRAWAKTGESRQLACGRFDTWEQLREVQLKFQVKDQKVFADSGFDAQIVYQKCVQFGHAGNIGGRKTWLSWATFKGSDAIDFLHTDAKGNKDRRIYAAPQFVNPGLGQYATAHRCTLFLWSNPSVKDILKRHRDNKAAPFLVPSDDAIYTEQMNSEYKKRIVEPKTGKESWRWVKHPSKENHLWDCECAQIVAASIYGVLGDSPKVELNPEPSGEPIAEPEPPKDDTL